MTIDAVVVDLGSKGAGLGVWQTFAEYSHTVLARLVGWVWFCDYKCSLIVLGRPAVNVLSYYEPLNYDPSLLRSQHTRVVRDESGRGTVQLHINAFNR